MLVKNNKETIMKFKSVAAALLAAVTCVSMAACGSGGDTNADGKVEITMWHNSTTGDGKAYWESAAKAFEKENPNVTIKIEAIQNEDMDGKLQTALQDPNSAPDIFMARGGQKLRDVVEAGQAMDLTDKISDTVKNQMATAEATGTIDGKIYSVQQSVLPGGIWYSKDLFEKAGITETPKTWDEFKTVVQKLKDAGITPIAVGGKDAWPAAHWWYWFALRECSADTFDKAQSDKDFSDKCWTRTGDDVQALLDLDAFNDGFLTTPAQQGASSYAGLLANHMVAMELMGFLNFVSEKEWQEKYAEAFSTIPANKEAQDVVTNEALKQVLTVYNDASSVSMWLDTVFGQNIGNALNEGVVNMMAGQGSAQDIVKGVETAAAKG